jgi:hypothetical protein
VRVDKAPSMARSRKAPSRTKVEERVFKGSDGSGSEGRRARLVLPPRQTDAPAPARREHVLRGHLPRPLERVPSDEVPRDEVRREAEGAVALRMRCQYR